MPEVDGLNMPGSSSVPCVPATSVAGPSISGTSVAGPSTPGTSVAGPSIPGTFVQKGLKRKFEGDTCMYGHEKEPILKYRFLDPELKQEFLMLIVMLYTGVRNITFDIQDGEPQTFIINYEWPELMTNVDQLFNIDGEPNVSHLHPQFIGAEAALRDFREHIDEKPWGKLTIPLPCKVSCDSNLWVVTFNKKPDGTFAVFFKLPVLETQFNSKKLNKVLVIP